MARAGKADRNRDKNDEFGRRKVKIRESVVKAQANAAKKKGKALIDFSPSVRVSKPDQKRAAIMHCRECGIELGMSNPLGDDICDDCCKTLYADEDDDDPE